MIGFLSGSIISKFPDHCVIDVGGVGYTVSVSLSTFAGLPEIGSQTKLLVHTHVREDILALYGFATEEEKSLFLKLIGISGVGPKTALAILSGFPVADLVEAIGCENRALLSTIPGVGRKTAERIIVELKDRIARETPSRTAPQSARGRLFEDVVSALTNLGYQRVVAESALKRAGWSDTMSIEDAIRAGLKELCRA